MGLIQKLLEPRATYAPWDDFWFNPIGAAGTTNAGVPVSIDRMQQIAAVYCARSILSETLAHVPLKINRRLERGKEVAPNHPMYRVLHDKANDIQTSMEWREQQMGDLVFRGNCYSEIVPGSFSAIGQLRPLLADRMKVVKLPNFRLGYNYRDDNGRDVAYTQDEVFHVRGYSNDGVTGISPVAAMRESMGLTLALDAFGALLFKGGANYGAVFEMPGQLSDVAYQRLKIELAADSGWNSAHKTKILEQGLKFSKTSMSADEAQFLLSRKFQISEIARWFHIPPHLLGDLEKATFSNIEHQSLEFVIFTMVPWFVRWEQRINADLILAPQTYFAEFVVDGLVRGDIKTRYEAYKSSIEVGWQTRNEVRGLENMNAAPGLDNFLVPQNMAEVDESGKIQPINKPADNGRGTGDRGPETDDGADAKLAALFYGDSEMAADQLDKELIERLEYFRRVTSASAERVVRKEGLAIAKALARYSDEPEKIEEWAGRFYRDQAKFISDVMCVEPELAEKFAAHQKSRLLASVKDNCAGVLIKELESAGPEQVLKYLKGAYTNGKHDSADLVAA